jgi:hypothetical protein
MPHGEVVLAMIQHFAVLQQAPQRERVCVLQQ